MPARPGLACKGTRPQGAGGERLDRGGRSAAAASSSAWGDSRRQRFPPQRLELEITESGLMERVSGRRPSLKVCDGWASPVDRRLRYRLFVARLPQALPRLKLKIDRSFIHDIRAIRTVSNSPRPSSQWRAVWAFRCSPRASKPGAARLPAGSAVRGIPGLLVQRTAACARVRGHNSCSKAGAEATFFGLRTPLSGLSRVDEGWP